ncbi:conserved hypothetical protein [Ricinus communis]|uniref:Uncharacterized protein n=1 Tax=Ricinus communis TaxID=3988 RepID=B9T6E4_RICCO|nr:conserved hypothetical protein [Ricinus communis]
MPNRFSLVSRPLSVSMVSRPKKGAALVAAPGVGGVVGIGGDVWFPGKASGSDT